MSGYPDRQGAKELLELMEQIDPLTAELEAARTQEAALNAAVVRRVAAEKALTATTKAIGKLLEEMDCASAGNWGFEGRMGYLLLELRKLILAKNKPAPLSAPEEPCSEEAEARARLTGS